MVNSILVHHTFSLKLQGHSFTCGKDECHQRAFETSQA